MSQQRNFRTYRDFRADLLHIGGDTLSDAIEEIADEMYPRQAEGELFSMWDTDDDDGE